MEEKITELVSKLNKHSERFVAGKLPAKWHMPSRIEEDVGKERTKMGGLQAKLRELELQASHIQHLIYHWYGGEDEMGDEDDEIGDEEDEARMGGEDDEMRSVEDSDSDILDVGNLPLGLSKFEFLFPFGPVIFVSVEFVISVVWARNFIYTGN